MGEAKNIYFTCLKLCLRRNSKNSEIFLKLRIKPHKKETDHVRRRRIRRGGILRREDLGKEIATREGGILDQMGRLSRFGEHLGAAGQSRLSGHHQGLRGRAKVQEEKDGG